MRRLPSVRSCHSCSPAAGTSFSQYPSDYREFAYVTNSGSNTVTVLDLVHLRQDRVVAVGSNPQA